jgi:diguanylate cyclase (GGDEF)-like protein
VTRDLSPHRVDELVDLLTKLASGDLSARGVPSAAEDDIDAVIVGVNMLAEELEAGQAELEQRVHERTAEFERLNADVMQLTVFGNLLQVCSDPAEAFTVVEFAMAQMFEGLSGALFVYNSSRNLLELKACWGPAKQPDTVAPDECWALRRGQLHHVAAVAPQLTCRHIDHPTGDSICIPTAALGDTTGMVHLTDHRLEGARPGRWLTDARQRLAVAMAEQTALALGNLELRETLRTQALRDPLTGLYNRRFVEDWISRETSRADHSGDPLGVVMADIDRFKHFNDTYGHEAGDRLLRAVADAITRELRQGDVPCRYGGEEFLLLMPAISARAVEARTEQLRMAVAGARIEHQGVPLPGVTLSAGIALYPVHGATATDVVKAADRALYAAKRAGRNRIVVATRDE